VTTNLLNYPQALAYTFLTPLLPTQAPWAQTAGMWVLRLAALAAVAWGLLRSRSELRARLRERGPQLVMLGLLCAPAVVSAISIYPRVHYLLLQGVLIALALSVLTTPAAAPTLDRRRMLGLSVAGLAVIVLTPVVGATWYAAGQEVQGSPNRDTVLFIRGLGITAPTNLLEAEGGFHVYLGDQFRRVPPFLKESDADTFLRERKVAMIVVSEKLLRDRRYANDPTWQAILADPAAAGFTRLAIPGTDRVLLLKR
jgi:hypothetical protein